MAGSGGFSISISAVDKTASPLDSINKRLARLNAPAERFNKAMARFGDVSGLSRMTEGFGALGRSATDAFASMDRMSGSVAALTSAGSIAGLVGLTSRFADLGAGIGRIGVKLNTPVEKLTAWEGAARRFGASTAQADQSLSGLSDAIHDAVFQPNSAARPLFAQLGIDPGTNGHIADTLETAEKIADVVQRIQDPNSQLKVMDTFGIDRNMLSLFQKGSAGIREEMERQRKLGATWTATMAKGADEASKSFSDLEGALGGVANRLGAAIEGPFAKWAEWGATLIGDNQDVADSYAKIGAGIGAIGAALVAIKPSLMLMRLLGLAGAAGAAGSAATLASPLLLSGDTPSDPLLNQPATSPGFLGQGGTLEQWIRHPTGGGFGGWYRRNAPSWAPGAAPDIKMDATKTGFLNTLAGPESGGQYDIKNGGTRFRDYSAFPEGIAPGGTSTAAGKYQFISKTWHSEADELGLSDFSPANQDKAAWHLADTTYRAKTHGDLETDLASGNNAMKIAAALRDVWPSLPGGSQSRESIGEFSNSLATNTAAASSVNLQVEVHDKRIVARTTTSGPGVVAPPARVERPMGGY